MSLSRTLYCSAEEHLVSADNHSHQGLVLKEQDVGSPTDYAVQVCLLDVEIHIKSVEHVEICAISEQIVDHLDISIAFLLVSGCVAAYLNSSRVEWSVLVLE